MKQQVKLIDICVQRQVLEQKLQNNWLNNIYDGNDENSRTLILKFNTVPEKTFLLVESGKRIHSIATGFTSIRNSPTWFVGKLRKHLKNQRLLCINQIAGDRVLDIHFANDYHLILELYDRGNFLLTLSDYTIVCSARTKPYEIKNKLVQVSYKYPMESTGTNPEVTSTKGYMIRNRNFANEPFDQADDQADAQTEEETKVEEFPTLDDAMREYFSSMKHNQAEKQQEQQEKQQAKQQKKQQSKEEKRHKGIERQVDNLKINENQTQQTAQYLEENIPILQQLIDHIKYNPTLEKIKSFHDQDFIAKFKKYEIFKKVKTIKLDDYEINYTKSAYQNISDIYTKKKQFTKKLSKAAEILEESVHKQERERQKEERRKENQSDGTNQLVIEKPDRQSTKQPIQQQQQNQKTRKPEKFESYWWIPSNEDSTQIIQIGKSADDNETLLNNMEPSDILVHGDFDKSPWGIIKNPKKTKVSIKTIVNAGELLVYRSWHWEQNVTNKAYYTTPDKVSKTAPSGEYMGKGSRMVHEKHYLSNASMEMGVGIVFRNLKKKTFHLEYNENIDYAVVVCGPFQMFKNYKFKVKAKPSGARNDKGRKKVITAIISKFMATKQSTQPEKQMIKAISRDEWDRTIIHRFKL
jgi:predicted ribosome quality control (RQC) complex YloA/Tae2 family protein